MPASISSKTSVSPPATAAIASAIRDSSPPDAVSATGANGRPGVRADEEGDVVGAGRAGLVALAQLAARNSPSPMPTPRELGRDGVGKRAARRRCARRAARARARGRAPRPAASVASRGLGGIDAVVERGELGRAPPRRARAAPRTSRSGSGASSSAIRSSSASSCSSRPGSASSDARKPRRSEAVSRRRSSTVAQLVAGGCELGRDAARAARPRRSASADEAGSRRRRRPARAPSPRPSARGRRGR